MYWESHVHGLSDELVAVVVVPDRGVELFVEAPAYLCVSGVAAAVAVWAVFLYVLVCPASVASSPSDLLARTPSPPLPLQVLLPVLPVEVPVVVGRSGMWLVP